MGRRSEKLRELEAAARRDRAQWTRRSFLVLGLGLILSIALSGLNRYDKSQKEELRALVLVNESHPLQADFTVDLQTIAGGKVDTQAAENLLRMIDAAKQEGIPLSLYATYLSVKEQREIYDEALLQLEEEGFSKEESEEKLKGKIQPPGTSEHHTGLAVDLVTSSCPVPDVAFAGTKAYPWLLAHAAEYGFILRYPKEKEEETGMSFAPWHFRYVGKTNAKKIQSSGQCLEEYLREHPQSEREGGRAHE